MRSNVKVKAPQTHEGAVASVISPEQELRRSVMACMLWEDQFYESGQSIADRISLLIKKVPFSVAAAYALEAKNQMKLRHTPLYMAVEIFKSGKKGRELGDLVFELIQRPDELSELLAIYWGGKGSGAPVPEQFKRGIARAFNKFSEYQFAKNNHKDRAVKLKDAMFLSRPKPKDENQARIFKAIADDNLATPDTWEVNLSAGKDKKETWERLLSEKKLGGLAFLRNLRNMQQVNVNEDLIKAYFKTANFEKVLPFRFISAARHAPLIETEIQEAMFKAVSEQPKLPGKTVLLVDNSGSMYHDKVSSKSDLTRSDAACALAILLKEICEESVVIAFSDNASIIPSTRRGFALRDAITGTLVGGTHTQTAINAANGVGYDRLILITDEQSHQSITKPQGKGYCINVASYKNGIGYGAWLHIDGFSEAIIDYIQAYEKEGIS